MKSLILIDGNSRYVANHIYIQHHVSARDNVDWIQIFGAGLSSEKYYISLQFRQWQAVDQWTRPLYNLNLGSGQSFPQNLFYNTTSCCPAGWFTSSASLATSSLFPYYKKCLKYFTTVLNFAAAEGTCMTNGGHLATVATYDENLFIDILTGGKASWIGLNDRAREGVWEWTDSTVSSNIALWNPGLVGNTAENDCFQVKTTTWRSRTCSTLLPFVCSINIPNMDVLSGITTNAGCGRLVKNQTLSNDLDVLGRFSQGQGFPGTVILPSPQGAAWGKAWTFSPDEVSSGGLLTLSVQGSGASTKLLTTADVFACPIQGCWSPPPPPPAPPPEKKFFLWSAAETWSGTLAHPGNPMNVLKRIVDSKGALNYQVISSQPWPSSVPSACDNVWIPPWRKVGCIFTFV